IMFDSEPMVPGASVASRPVNRTLGYRPLFETLYPRAMLPSLSMAALPIHRKFESPFVNVPCWKRLGVPLGLRTSYQRTPVWPFGLFDALTEWLTTRASWPSANLR